MLRFALNRTPARRIPPLPFEAYNVCLFKQHLSLEVGFTTISLFYGTKHHFPSSGKRDPRGYFADLLAFSLIVYLAARSNMFRSSLLGIIAQDATVYFLIIFTSHLVLELTLILGRVRIFSRRLILFSPTETLVAYYPTTPRDVSGLEPLF